MKNWKTTTAGLIAGLFPAVHALITAFNSGYFTEKTGWQLFFGIAFIVIGALSKDFNVTGGNVNNSADIGGGGQQNPDPKPKP